MLSAIENLQLIHASNFNSWQALVVAGADFPMPVVGSNQYTAINGEDRSQRFNNNGAITGAGKASAYLPFDTAYDVSAVNQAIVIHHRYSILNGYHRLSSDSDSLEFALVSGEGTDNYVVYSFGGANDPVLTNDWNAFILTGTPSRTGGNFNASDVTGMAYLYKTTSGTGFSINAGVCQILHINGPIHLVGGELGNEASMAKYAELMGQFSGTPYHNLLVSSAGPTTAWAVPVSVRSDLYVDNNPMAGVSFRKVNRVGIQYIDLGYYELDITPPANGSITFTSTQFSSLSLPYGFTIDASAEGAQVYLRTNQYAAVDNFTVVGEGVRIEGGDLIDAETCSLSGALINGLKATGCASAVMIDGDLAPGTDMDITNAFGAALQFNVPPGDYDHIVFNLDAGAVVNYNASEQGTYSNLGLFKKPGLPLVFDNLSPHALTVAIDPEVSAVLKEPLTDGALVIDNAVLATGVIAFNDILVNDPDAQYFMYFADGVDNGLEYGADSAVLVNDASGNPITGLVAGSGEVAFNFDIDRSVQAGRVAGSEVRVIAVAVGLSSGKYVRTEGVIKRSDSNSIALAAELERQYQIAA